MIDGPVFEAILPGAWHKLIARCLAQEPQNRYPTANALLNDLKVALFDSAQERQRNVILGESEGDDKKNQFVVSSQPGETMAGLRTYGAVNPNMTERYGVGAAYNYIGQALPFEKKSSSKSQGQQLWGGKTAVASFVIGTISVLTFIIALFCKSIEDSALTLHIVGGFFGLIGIILGGFTVKGNEKKEVAIGGLVLSIIGVVLRLLLLVLFFVITVFVFRQFRQ
ncbi:MAG: hypothetical protein ACOYEB_12850 [Enterococcus lemanii]